LRNQFYWLFQSLLKWHRSPSLIPSFIRSCSGLFCLGCIVILHLKGLTWKHSLLTANLDSYPSKWEGAIGGTGDMRFSLSLQRPMNEQLHCWNPARELGFCCSATDRQRSSTAPSSKLITEPLCFQLFWYLFTNSSTKTCMWNFIPRFFKSCAKMLVSV
jgi:hypothetical protein